MNRIWFVMIVGSLCALVWINPEGVLPTMLSACSDAFNLALELCAVYAVWLGILELVEVSGLSQKLAKLLRPFIRRIFKIKDEEAEKMIALNMSANILGLGNASTPMGLGAMKKLDKGQEKASHAIIMLIVVNATSIQLLPTTIIGLRTSAGSTTAGDIILPTILCTIFTFVLGISLVLWCSKIRTKLAKRREK